MRWVAVILLMAMSSAAIAMEDTPENRERQVERYLEAVPPKAMFNTLMTNMLRGLPEGQREAVMDDMTKNFDVEPMIKIMRASMAKTFTADELAALADFYSSPVGKSAMSKMGNYMADFMAQFTPILTAQMSKIAADARKGRAKKPMEELQQQQAK